MAGVCLNRVGLITALLLGSALGSGRADEIALSRVGNEWKFIPGLVEPAGSSNAWQLAAYDDHAWFSGRSGFSAGYISEEATSLPTAATGFPFNYTSAYFRRTFTLTNPAAIHWLTLRVDYTDGFVAFLNGREVARRNLSGSAGLPVSFSTLATNFHGRASPEEIDLTLFRGELVSGENTLAFQVHGTGPSYVGLCLSAELMANFNRAPHLQNMSSNQVQLIWKTPVPADSQVEFGATHSLGTNLTDTNLVTTHEMTLSNLHPDSVYFYRVASSVAAERARTELRSFRTFKTGGPVRFAVFGDGGWNSLPQYQIASVLQNARPDFVIEVGDNVYPSFTRALADSRCFSASEPRMRTVPYFFALGNHDLYSGVTNYLEAFSVPTNSVPLSEHLLAQTSPEHYYSFDQGDVHFVVLFIPYLSQYRLTVGDPQYRWLTNDLATTSRPWKIVFGHVPMHSSSAHRRDDVNFNGVPDRLEVREELLPVLGQYGVQLLLCGHEHGYERFNPTNGVHSITTAGGGGVLYGFSELDFASALFWARFNCVRVSVANDTLEAEALGTDGEAFDAVTIRRRLPPPKVSESTWHTPEVESTPANDTDGNVIGQRFDLAGEPIPALAGQFSNLGRLFINNDQTNLYIGLDRVMIHGDNSLFLFIESARLSGVAHMAVPGEGAVGTNGVGADGLGNLRNLSFTNFSPAIGCILGDEYGDGLYRNFTRKALPLNIGQGVFRLDAQRGNVPGIRLQQYHLSPQFMGAGGEENANFIELAIPLAELGGLQPGDLIRLGGVVGSPDVDIATRTWGLDSGFVGTDLIRVGERGVILGGVTVQLAWDPRGDDDGDGLARSDELALGTDPTRADTDGDGLPDGWEVENYLDPLFPKG